MPFSAGSRYSDGDVEEITTTPRTLTVADSGKIFRVGIADCVFNLPSTELGLFYHIVVDVTSSTVGCAISPVAGDNINGGTDGKDLRNTAATDDRGDSVTIVGDGDKGWLTTSMHGIWAFEP